MAGGSLTQMVVPALPALLPRSPDDAVDGDHMLLYHRPVPCAMLRHELPYGVVVVLRPRASTTFAHRRSEQTKENIGTRMYVFSAKLWSVQYVY